MPDYPSNTFPPTLKSPNPPTPAYSLAVQLQRNPLPLWVKGSSSEHQWVDQFSDSSSEHQELPF